MRSPIEQARAAWYPADAGSPPPPTPCHTLTAVAAAQSPTVAAPLSCLTVAVAMLVDLRVSQATQMPWCAGTNTGHSFHYNCSLPTYEMCVQEVIAGNRGFCGPNPYYRGPEVVPPRAKRKRYYY
jgi:hypothetical protein